MQNAARATGISGWLVAAGVVALYLTSRYDITIQDQGPLAQVAAIAGSPGSTAPTSDERYARIKSQARTAVGAELLGADRRLESAEREFPSDYRFSYERAALAVYGRANHHEAFSHLRRAAEKAIATQRSDDMLHRLETDARPGGPLRRLALGHDEWSALTEALEHSDPDRLWREHLSHRARPRRVELAGVSLRMTRDTPCVDALIAQRRAGTDPEARAEYHRLRELCLNDSER